MPGPNLGPGVITGTDAQNLLAGVESMVVVFNERREVERMIRGTTPTYTLFVEGHDLTGTTVFVTFKNDRRKLVLSGERLSVTGGEEESIVAFGLTQEETLALKEGTAQIQVRFIDSAGVAYATDIGKVTVGKVLQEGVIEYAGD